ncbi:MAG: ROK family protein, partial [Clostridia bacterium]|nr:ROK family protein [Clostridia bacterium]
EFSEIMADAAHLIEKLLKESGKTAADIQAIGMGTPGIPGIKEKTVIYASNFPKVRHGNLQDEMRKYFPGVNAFVENDANAAAYGEALAGAAKGVRDAVVVTLGTGVGGGVIIGGKISSHFNNVGSEIGHQVINFNGPACPCGRCGCFEAYASATALIRQTKEMMEAYPHSVMHDIVNHNYDNVNGKTAFDAAKQGDEAGLRVVKNYIEYLGIGIVNIINVFQPEAVVIGGGICKEGEYLLAPLREYVSRYIYTPDDVPTAKLTTAKLGNDAGIIGAAMLWKQQA